MKNVDVTLKMVKELIKELKDQVKSNDQEMRYHAKGMSRDSFAAASHLDSVNGAVEYIIDELAIIVEHGKV